MGWEMPWYSAEHSLNTLLVGRNVGKLHLGCYQQHNSYDLLDLTVYGRQEKWEDSPPGWLK
jgi:predicted dithiol-disulfide oxidoreductase (DUF899 family)